MSVLLKGIAWGHTRALAPLLATSQVYKDFHPDIAIQWETRSLLSFGEGDPEALTRENDLVLVDHPFMGAVAAQQLFLPFDQHVPEDILNKLKAETLGRSYESYHYAGHQWALPIDGAAQVSASRKDLFEQAGAQVPVTWKEAEELAKDTGKVAMPMTPMSLLSSFFTLCANQGEEPFSGKDAIVDTALGEHVIRQLQSLYKLMPSWCLDVYPPFILHKMVTGEEVWYVPLTFGYVNYSMPGYAPHPLTFNNIPSAGRHGVTGSVSGGVGISVSSRSRHAREAFDFCVWVTGAACQKTLYAYAGGQPGNRRAWEDPTVNAMCNNFYRNTLETLARAFMRPRYNGFHGFQSAAGRLLQACMREERSIGETFKRITEQYIMSKNATVNPIIH